MNYLILLFMIFCHIIDDYKIQAPVLNNLKQKAYWTENAPDKLYRYDYLMALFMHSFSWAFMILLPLTIYALINNGQWHWLFFVVNLVIHFVVDDLKANHKKINLIQDQMIHLAQIVVTWFFWIYVC